MCYYERVAGLWGFPEEGKELWAFLSYIAQPTALKCVWPAGQGNRCQAYHKLLSHAMVFLFYLLDSYILNFYSEEETKKIGSY